jgi:hypothetical protein
MLTLLSALSCITSDAYSNYISTCLCHDLSLTLLAHQLISPPPGGKGTPRRKQVKKSVTATQGDDRKLQAALKKLGTQPIAGVEEVNMFKEDGNVLHFAAPRGEFGLVG